MVSGEGEDVPDAVDPLAVRSAFTHLQFKEEFVIKFCDILCEFYLF